jgi:POT family proton-dependent oligopeptide transporter
VATEDAVKPAAGTTPAPALTGHPTGFWFFFWGEFAERCSYYGMRAILALYMVDRLGVDKADAGTYMSLFIAACYFFPLIGGFVADNFLGKYWTIVGFSIPYVVAQLVIGIENKYLVFGTLGLLAMGSGVIKPNISTLMGLTYDQQRPGQDQLRTSAFSWFYMSINIGAFLSQVSMPWLRTNYGYQVAFLFPAGLMAMALLVFAAGKKFYAK